MDVASRWYVLGVPEKKNLPDKPISLCFPTGTKEDTRPSKRKSFSLLIFSSFKNSSTSKRRERSRCRNDASDSTSARLRNDHYDRLCSNALYFACSGISLISVLRSVNFFDLFGLFGTASYERVDDSSKFLNLRVLISAYELFLERNKIDPRCSIID